MDLIDNKKVTSTDEIIFKSKSKNLYISDIDIISKVTMYTDELEEVLAMPNTINFKNSKKYKDLMSNPDIVPVRRTKKIKYEIYLEEL
ncbi:hypothetical protein SAP1_001 [Staphylococcus phage StAP1]|nr:hypothetical protein SAP1_001 [Staphylococcus phage StAP1]